jgi:hypothetical protein
MAEEKVQEVRENCAMKSFIICTAHQVLLA